MHVLTLARSPSPSMVLGVALAGVVVYILISRLLATAFPGKRPPIFEGIPFVGGLLKFIEGPMYLMRAGFAKHGEVFTVPIAHKRITFLIGPTATPHFFKATDEELSQTEVYGYSVPTFGKGVVYDVDQKVRTEQFRFFTEALKKDRLKSYVPQFVMEAEQYFAKWGQEGVIDFAEEFGKLISYTAARTLLGREVREQMFDEVAKLLHDLDDGMIPISVIFPYLPIPAHKKRDRAREEFGRLFGKVVRSRRESGRREEDVLQQFIDARYQNVLGGRALTEDEIAGLLIATIFAGQHTSSITSSWTGLYMNSHKAAALRPAEEEQTAIMKKYGGELSFEVLQEMEVLQRNILEALRMHPPLILVLRYVKEPFTVTTTDGKEYCIPKGDIVAASPNFSHMLPYVFKNADKYEPDRFGPPRDEQQKPFAFIGFGGGRHGCLGSNFALLQIKTIWSVLLRNFEFELLDPIPEPNYQAMVIGPKPCRVRYQRRKLTA